MILAETQYETYNGELLAIIEAFKTWRHYLEGCKHKVLVLTNHNNLRQFMDTTSLSSRQLWWAQKLSQYHFWINYCQGKANGAADALSRFSQRSHDEKEKLRAENTQILHCLQTYWQTQASQALVITLRSTFHPSTEFSFAGLMCSLNYVNFRTSFKWS